MLEQELYDRLGMDEKAQLYKAAVLGLSAWLNIAAEPTQTNNDQDEAAAELTNVLHLMRASGQKKG